MANKNRKPINNNFPRIEFLNYTFDKSEKAQFDSWYMKSGETFVKAVWETLQADYKLSLSWDDEHECYIAAMTGKDTSLNPHRCISMRSKDWAKALAAVAYVNTVVFGGEVWDWDEGDNMV